MRGGWTYIMASKPRGMLYIGVDRASAERVDQHRRDVGSAFCRRYGIRTLVLAEPHDDIQLAIALEKALKAWKRDWKIALIERTNPGWDDLFDRTLTTPVMPA
ncbi:GIY-YIG nuclease family protein [Sphingomonas adhaesiva]|uniref:GIY-YIG nuclease family protein n=1 Tax=Sphingomonas adhaesiva TaxID=28212 RepID=UPI002FF8A509